MGFNHGLEEILMSRSRLLSRKNRLGLRALMAVIASVVVATIGAAPAYALPDRANVTRPVGVAAALAAQPPACDLKIAKTMSQPVSGQPATVTLTVVNVGTGVCPPGLFNKSTVLSDNKPSGLTFTGAPVASPPGGWVCSLPSGNATCVHPGALPPNFTVTFTVKALVTGPARTGLVNCAEIANPADTNPANNRSCVALIVEPGPPPKCDLKITKTMSPTPLVSGQTVMVTLTVVNLGPGACAPGAFPGTTLRDDTPPGLTFTGQLTPDQPGWSCSLESPSGNATCASPGTLPNGYAVTFTINAKVTAPPRAIVTNCAQITNQNDTNPTNNRSCVTKRVV